jgi:hypothetical protein
MIRFRIQLARVPTLMAVFVLSGIGALLPCTKAVAQFCAGGTLGTVNFDTVATQVLSGGPAANGTFTYTIPQFNLAASNLYAVEIKSTILTASATANIFNFTGVPGAPLVNLIRSDNVTTSAVNGTIPPGSYFSPTVYTGPVLPANGNEIISMPNAVTNQQLITDSVTDATSMTNFTGASTVKFTYSQSNFPFPQAGMNALATTATSTVDFSITYYYCTPYILAIHLISFTATRENPQTIQLAWTSENEEANRTYNVQVSSNGTDFSDVGSVQSDPVNTDASYTYNYPVSPTATGRLFFRLRMVDNDGAVTFSSICLVNLNGSNTTAFSIYPNPATDFINLVLPGGNQSWNVDIIAADGNLIQRNVFSNTALGRVDFTRKLARGTYFVRATNTTSGEQHGGSFVIPE